MPLTPVDIAKTHAPGIGIAAGLTLIPTVAEAIEPGSLPGIAGDSPTWVTPLIMGLGLLLSKGIELVKEWRSRDHKDLEKRVESGEKRIAELVAENQRLVRENLETTKKVFQLEADVEVAEVKAGQSATDLAPHRSNRGPE